MDFDAAFDAAIVSDEAQLAKFVHEETHARAGSSDHLRKRLLADFSDHRFGLPFLAEVCQQQEHSGQTFLARIEQLIDKIRFNADGPAQKMGNEQLGERWFKPLSVRYRTGLCTVETEIGK